MSNKLPAFQFYPGDWLKDPNLRRCSPQARGVWIDILCLMFENNPRGELSTKGVGWTALDIQNFIAGSDREAIGVAINELILNDVMCNDSKGIFFCKRMRRDEKSRIGKQKGAEKTNALRWKNSTDINELQNQRLAEAIAPCRSSSSSSSSVHISKDIRTKKNIKKKADDELPKSEIYQDCKFFRMSDSDKTLAETWFTKNKFPLELMRFAIMAVDNWLSDTKSPKAREARNDPTHYRRLYASWALRNAKELMRTQTSNLPTANVNRFSCAAEYREAQAKKAFMQSFEEDPNDQAGNNNASLHLSAFMADVSTGTK